mmetsp:Transcript_88305/g.175521  ORF Transcript_88305/g.175521 Transcript_88305/m.175521 type:complete len:515 (-) Transcript_88305:336-1880(-)
MLHFHIDFSQAMQALESHHPEWSPLSWDSKRLLKVLALRSALEGQCCNRDSVKHCIWQFLDSPKPFYFCHYGHQARFSVRPQNSVWQLHHLHRVFDELWKDPYYADVAGGRCAEGGFEFPRKSHDLKELLDFDMLGVRFGVSSLEGESSQVRINHANLDLPCEFSEPKLGGVRSHELHEKIAALPELEFWAKYGVPSTDFFALVHAFEKCGHTIISTIGFGRCPSSRMWQIHYEGRMSESVLNSEIAPPHSAIPEDPEPLVIEDIEHSDPSEIIPDDEAAALAAEQWAQGVENRIKHGQEGVEAMSITGISVGTPEETKEDSVVEKVHVLRFGSAPSGGSDCWKFFEEALLHGPQLSTCIQALKDDGFPCKLPSGAFVFVPPTQYTITCKALVGMELHPFHVVVSQSFEYLIEEILYTIPFRRRPKVKPEPHGRKELQGIEVDMENSGGKDMYDATLDERDDKPCIFVEARSFLNVLPLLKDARSVAQSTTEAVTEQSTRHYSSFRGYNPRRFV